jgi:hypothetical protein
VLRLLPAAGDGRGCITHKERVIACQLKGTEGRDGS